MINAWHHRGRGSNVRCHEHRRHRRFDRPVPCLLVGISVLAALGLTLVPDEWVGWLGLLPLGIGVFGLIRFLRRDNIAIYQGLPVWITDPGLLPVTTKAALMAHFDDWVTETAVNLEGVRSFVDDPSLVGAKFLNRYTVATTSGTTGTRGVFLLDTRSLAVAKALTFRMFSSWLTPADILGIIRGRGRIAMVIATGGHFASAAAAAALQRGPDRHSGGCSRSRHRCRTSSPS